MKSQDKRRFLAPNQRMAVVLHNCKEVRMGCEVCEFGLFDSSDTQLENFKPLSAFGVFGCWDQASMVFVLPAGTIDSLFLYNVDDGVFTLIRVSNVFSLDLALCDCRVLELAVKPAQIKAANCRTVLGGGLAECPVERFRPPERRKVDLSQLVWRPRGELPGFDRFVEGTPRLDMNLIPDGYFMFTGKFPESTVDKVNGRLMTVWHLTRFAEYGDPQAVLWLEEVKRLAGEKLQNGHSVMRYLGAVARKLPFPKT